MSYTLRIAGLLAAALVAAGLLAATLAPASANAATGVWTGIPSHNGASGSAIIDYKRIGYWSSDASGRIYLRTGSGCAKVQFAPYAIAAVDGTWNNTGTWCNGVVTISWSDRFYLAYNGMKFRICKSGTCGSVGYIRF